MRHRFGLSRALALLLLLSTSAPTARLRAAPNDSEGVRLVLSTKEIAPTTTFELRFDEPMVAYENVGSTASTSPLVITPALPGKFVWLSQRSGVFTPDAAPALGADYHLSLGKNLRKADGQPAAAALDAHVQTPPMSVTKIRPSSFPEKNAPSSPKIIAQLNVRVSAEALAPFVTFQNAAGLTIPALVAQAVEDDGYFGNEESEQQAWRDRFAQAHATPSPAPNDRKTPAPIPDRIVIRSAQPLPIGPGWRCLLGQGLPASDGPEKLPADYEIKIGDVTPFTVSAVEAHNTIDEGKWLAVNFSKDLSPLLKAEELTRWFTLDPTPEKVRFEPGGASVVIHGDFRLDQHYTVKVAPGLPAEEPFQLEAPFEKQIAFAPQRPRLYFPALTTAQLSGGRRTFDLRAINLPEARVRARLLDRDALVFALAGYNSGYAKNSAAKDLNQEPYRGLPFDLVPGPTVFDQDFNTSAPRDVARTVSLSWDKLLHGRRTGAVFLEAARTFGRYYAETPSLGTQAIVQLTDIGLVWKSTRADAWIYAFSQETGEPLAGATLRLVTEDNKLILTRQTDARGWAEFPRSGADKWLVAQHGDDLHAIAFGTSPEDGIPLYAFHLPLNFWESDARVRRSIFLFADRPVYQPGETIHLKGIVRDREEGALVFPAVTVAELRVNNPDDEKVWEKQITLSPDGAFAEDIALPHGRLGGWSAILDFGQNITRALEFRVEEYQPAAFQVAIDAPASYAAAALVRPKVDAHYFSGVPLAGRTVRWSIEARDEGFQPDGFSKFAFGPIGEDNESEDAIVFTAQDEAKLGPDGAATLALDVPTNPKLPQPRRCSLLVEITDLGQSTISDRRAFVRQSSAFYLGLQRLGEVALVGHAVPLNLVAVQPDGHPCGETIQAKVTIEKRAYHTVRELGAGGAPVYRTTTTFKPVFSETVGTLPLQKSGDAWEVSVKSTAQFTPNEVGSYRLRATAQDRDGHPIETDSDFSVAAEEPRRTAWDYRNQAQIELEPDKTSYAPGEQAILLVKTPINGEALVTVEQEEVRRSFLVRLQGNSPIVRVPIETGDAPNVFVSLIELRGRAQSPRQIKTPEYRVGYAQLNVVRPEDKLALSFAPGERANRPGAEITSSVTVKNSAGPPAANAEVALYAVDEGTLSLIGYKTPDPWSFFYATQPLRVQTGLTLPSLFPEDVADLTFSNKGFLVGGGGNESAAATRKNFLATAFWKADLKTDAAGKVAVHFTAPDNLTRFRLIAVANSGIGRFGSGESSFEINKPLMLEPALPRFGNVGDQVLVRAVLHNRSALSGEAEITLQLDDKTKEHGALVRRVALAAGASATVDFPVEFQNPGEAQWIWTAKLGQDANAISDSVESKLPVGFAAPLLHEVLVDRTQARAANLFAEANPQFLEGTGKFAVRVANTRLSGVGEAVNYLLRYPYGCAEQTVSNMLPWIVAPELQKAVPELRAPKEKAQHAIELGIDRLLTMQTANGGLSFWPHERTPMLWASAYGGVALALAERAGYDVPVAMLDHLGDYLRAELRHSADLQGNAEMSDHLLALYALALAGHPENSYHEFFYNKRAQLSAESRAVLALAILESHGPAAMVEELLHPPTPAEPPGDVNFGSSEREQAVRLLAWSQYRPNDHAVDGLAEELLHARRHGRWPDTQSNAWAILGLTKYASAVETGDKKISGSLTYERTSSDFQLNENTHVFEEAHQIAAVAPGATPPPLTLSNPDAGLLFTQLTMEARPRVALQPRQDRGFLLQRHYQKVNNDGSLGATDALRVGDRILVTLQIEVRQAAHYVAIDDALPAIFEALNPEFKTQATRAGEDLTSNWRSDYRELRHDRALFFRNHLPPGNYTIRYLARVRAAGEVTAPAAKIEEMYHPEHFGLSAAIAIKSAPQE